MLASNYIVDVHPEVKNDHCESNGSFDTVESDTDVIDASMHSDSTAESEGDVPLQRTQSQVTKQKQVGVVIEHISERQSAMQDLQRIVSALEEQSLTKEAVATVTAALKQARNLGEDLMEDMLSLDSLSNLFLEDRTARKKAISDIESLLSDVDTVKAQLSKFRSRLDTELAKPTVEADHQPSFSESRTLTSHEVDSREMQEDSQEMKLVDKQRISYPEQSLFAVPQAPGRTTWEQQHLSLQFHAHEERQCYLIQANAPGLDVQDLKLQLNSDSSTLLVEGVCLPTAKQKAEMRRIVASQLQQFAHRAPKQFAQLGGAPGMSPEAFAKLSQGSFGRFSQSFSIPSNVAISHIDASYEDGKLKIVLPKRRVVPAPTPYLRQHPYHAVRGGLSPWW
eukprot:gnl/MRDRNA2_/MRDRNA2_89275_c0_seq1.p1 gnl/MRDRNA2_/MRDRNA2_89275_c0~~gnl/MRDRNA2_/MRDRNA2_89275_c0_seq1.p1  ORF type:complete len:394 (-),score=91.31 gnl/MRDRNA2_/MRDRNA2_89275_c0_seq1:224-1405(-)